MYIDLIKLISEALKLNQCDDKIAEDLDPHAPIELHFDSVPMIRAEMTPDEAVVLSCQLSEEPVSWSDGVGMAVLDVVMQPAPWSSSSAVSLLDMEGKPGLVASVAKRLLVDGEQFSVAMGGFYDRVRCVIQALRQ